MPDGWKTFGLNMEFIDAPLLLDCEAKSLSTDDQIRFVNHASISG